MNILLVESHYRTRTWRKALQSLEDNLYVISVVAEERDIFYANGLSKDNLLDLHNPVIESYSYTLAESYLLKLELEMGLCVNEIALMDRTLRLKDSEYIIKYLYHIAKNVRDFIENKKIELVFIEPTWSHEILITAICKSLGIPVYAPVKDKIIANRFFMFEGYKHLNLFTRNNNPDKDKIAKKSIDSILIPDEKPQYFSQFNKRNKFTFSKFRVLYDISKLLISGKNNNNIQPPWAKAVKKKLTSIAKARYFSLFSPFIKQKNINKNYILITLHVQPEASIDVVGVKYFDQIDFVRQIVRTTPANHLVVVKEHPHAFGDRPLNFYKELLSIPRVEVLSPFSESRHAIKKAKLVISNTGTSSLEAAIMGIPGVTATEMYFKDLMVTPSFNPSIDRVDKLLLKCKIWKANFDIGHIHSIMRKIQNNSFKGNSGDFKTDRNVLSRENIQNLRDSFSEVINSFKK